MSYWEQRALARQAIYDRASAKTLKTVGTAYDRMVRQLADDAERIVGNYTKYFGLSKAEGMKLLKEPAPKAVLDDIRARIPTIQDKAIRLKLEAQVSAEAYAARLTRLQAIQESAQINALQAADVEVRVGKAHLTKTLKTAYMRTMFDIQKDTGLGFGFAGVDTRRINQILRYNWSGKQFSARVWRNANTTARTLSQALTEVVLQGKTSKQTFDTLMEQANGSRLAANRLLRTETNYISNQATAEALEDAGIERYIFTAVLDGRTSRKCQDRDNKEYALADKEVGVNYPPLHVFCRSTISPVVDGDVRAKQTRWARNPETGEQMKVRRDMSYADWKAAGYQSK